MILNCFRLHDKSTSTPVELKKALKKTAGEISGPLGSNKIDLMKKAASLAGIKGLGSSSCNKMRKLGVE